jgi:hypothetical protein
VRRTDRHARAGEPRARCRLGDAEIRHHRVTQLVEHDVVGLHVAVHDAVLVRVAQRTRGLNQQVADLGRRQPPAPLQLLGERLAPQQLHHDVGDAGGPADAIDRDDVGVLEPRRRPRLALEALDELGVERERERQDLERHLPLQLPLAGAEHDRHPAATELFDDLVLGLERVVNDVRFGPLAGGHGAGRLHRRRRREVQSARRTEPRRVVNLVTAPRTKHARFSSYDSTWGCPRENSMV